MKTNRKKQPALQYSLFGSNLPLRRALNLAILAALYPAFAYANPNGAQIVNGQVTINTSTPGVTTVTNSPNAIINWQNFSIAQNELTQFIQQNGQSAVLNRIIGQNPSEILGQLASNGKVFLINPNGIVFGAGSVIDTQGLIASSLNLSDQDFLSGNYHFMAGSGAGNILNEGIIRAGKDGNIILIAPQIQNNGIIKSDGGSITLAAGQELTITNLDSPDIRFQIQAPTDSGLNLGKLLSEGGAINVFASTIKHSGEINADSVQVDKQGRIQLVAGQDITLDAGSKISANNSQGNAGTIHIDSKTGTTLAQGSIEAQATQTGKGGNIELLGERVGVLDHARIDATGVNGGGQVLAGGDYQGKNPTLHNAKMTYIGKDATIKADAKTSGDGGKIIVWADDTTRVHGNISTKGGTNTGNGGFVETSGHSYLDVAGARVDTRAPKGSVGNWLLDPTDITIIHGTTTAATFSSNVFNNGGGATSSLTDGDINTALNTSSVTIQTTSANVGALGDITFDSTGGAILISETNATPVTLTLNAENNIVFTGANGTTFRTPNSTGQLDVLFNVPATGKVITNAGSSVTLDGSSIGLYGLTRAWLFDGRAWDNNGTLNITDKAAVHLGIASSFNNKSGGIANIAGTTGWAGSQDGIVNNAGTINVNLNTSWGAKFSQTSSGILNLHNDLSMQHLDVADGTINIDSGKTLKISEVHTGLNKFDGAWINGPGRLQIGDTLSSFLPTVIFNNVTTIDLTVLREQTGTLVFSGANTFDNTKFFASGTTNIDWAIPTANYSGNTEWWAKGDITLNNNLSTSGNITLSAGWDPSIATPASTLTGMITNNAVLSGANIILQADKMALANGTINGSSSVSLLSANVIGLATVATDNQEAELELSSAELNTITTPTLRIGNVGSGAIDIKSPLSLANFNTKLNLTSGGAITQQPGATIGVTALNASGASVTLTEANPVGVVSGSASSGDFRYRSSNLLTISTVDGVNGISVPTAGSTIALESDAGINQQAGANLNTSGGGLALKTKGSVTLFNLGNNIGTVAADLSLGGQGTGSFGLFSSNNLTVGGVLSADGATWLHGITTNNQPIDIGTNILNINQPVNAGIATVDLKTNALIWDAVGPNSFGRVSGNDIGILPLTSGRPISVGAACVGGPGTCLSITELWKIASPLIGIGFDGFNVGNHVAGNIFVEGITVGGTSITDRNAATNRIGLFSNGGITQNSTAINVQDLAVEANGTVLLNAANNINNLAAKTLGQNFTFANSQGISVVQINAPYYINGIETCATAGTCGNVSITTNAGDLNIPAQINAGTGTVNLTAANGSVFGSGTSPDIIAGNVIISAYNNILGSGGLHISSPLLSQLSATTGFIDIQSVGSGLSLGTVNAYNAIKISSSSPITVNGAVASTIGDISLSSSILNINNQINAGSADVSLTADKLAWDTSGFGKVLANLVDIRPYTTGRAITVGAACVGGLGSCLSITELWRVSAPTIGLGDHNAGDVYVSGITNGVSTLTDRNALTTRIGLLSNAGITQSATPINVQDLGIEANGIVLLNAANRISNLAGNTLGQNFTFNNGQGFNVVQMSGGTASYSNNYYGYNNYYDFNHSYNINGIDTCAATGNCGNVTLSATGSVLANSAPIIAANLTVKSGGDATLAGLNLISGILDINAAGNIYSRTQGVSQMSSLNSSNGWIDVENIGGFILGSTVLTPGTTVVNAASNITITAKSPLTVNGAISSSGGSVNLTASNNDILSLNAPISAPGGIKLAGGLLTGSNANLYTQYFNNGTTLSNTVTTSTEKVIAGVLGTTPQSGQSSTNESNSNNGNSNSSTDPNAEKNKKLKQCTK